MSQGICQSMQQKKVVSVRLVNKMGSRKAYFPDRELLMFSRFSAVRRSDGAQDPAQEKGEPSQQASEVITCGGEDGVDGIYVPLSAQPSLKRKAKPQLCTRIAI